MPTAPLSHLRLVECATFVAGPSCGLSLAQLGADVIRVDLPGGGSDAGRWPVAPNGASLYWASLNKGKRSITIDYRSPAGRELLLALASAPGPGAGLFTDNMVGRHRVTHDDLAARRADVITLHLQGFPDERPAVDYTVNAAVGVPDLTGPVGTADPVNHVLPAWDLLAGSTGATALLAAVTRRDRTGEGSRIELALSDVALSGVGVLGWLAEAESAGQVRPRLGNHVFGSFGVDLASSDGERLMVVALTPGQWRSLCRVTGTEPVFAALETALGVDLREESARYELRETIASILRPWFAARPMARLHELLDDAHVLWGPYRTVLQAAADARTAAGTPTGSVAAQVDQPGIGPMLATGTPLRFDGDRPSPVPGPLLGADTDGVLADVLGLSDAEVGRLHDEQTVG